MPRTARKRSASGVYHIVLRGINKQIIFYDDEDREVFLSRLKMIKSEVPYSIYAFCLMSNHIHLLVKEEQVPIGKIFQKILCSYVYWYNRKYERIGNLFQDRYKSEAINNDRYLLCAARYIHRNPLKAGMINDINDYEWSSYKSYLNDKKSFVDIDLLLAMLQGKEEYIKFMSQEEEQKFLEFENMPPISDEKLLISLEKIYKKYKISDILRLEREGRDEVLSIIRKIPGVSIRQVSRVTGVPVSIVRHIK